MSQMLFPTRQRCKQCRKSLGPCGAPVWLGLYCSARCADMPPVPREATSPAVPRACRTERDGTWVFKRRYRSVQEIPDRVRDDPSTSWYWCTQSCGHLHVGRTLSQQSSQGPKRAENRRLSSRADIADVLMKARGSATIKQAAVAIQVRPIRVAECEDPAVASPSLDVLLKLAALYRIELVAVFR